MLGIWPSSRSLRMAGWPASSRTMPKRSCVVRLSALAALFTSFFAAADFAVLFAVFFSTAAATFLVLVAVFLVAAVVFLVAAVVFLAVVGTLTSMVRQIDRS